MEFNIKQKTRFDVGDVVYVYDTYRKNEKILKGTVTDIVLTCHGDTSRPNNYFYFVLCDGDHIPGPYYEEYVFKTEYEAKIAVGNRK